VVIYPFFNDNLDGEKSKQPELSEFQLPRPIYAFIEFENTHLIGVGYEGHFFSFDLTAPQIKVPLKSRLEGI
jgi:hypothetical protein